MSSQNANYDAIIVGAGHNGLVCGNYLARAGLKTLVLERRGIVGGAAVTEEISPGFRATIFSFVMGSLHPRVIADLELEKYGVKHLPVQDVVTPLPDGNHIIFSKDHAKNQREIARFSTKDAEVYPQFVAYLGECLDALKKLILETPIDPSSTNTKDLLLNAKFVWRHRKIGDQFYRLYDALTMSANDYLDQWFESEVVKAIFVYWAQIGCNKGPSAPGTAFGILYHLVGENGVGYSQGGMGKITEALAVSGQSHGLDIMTDAEVSRIDTINGRARGVTLKDGREFKASRVISNAAAGITFKELLDPADLPDEFNREINGYRSSGTAFKINVAFDGLPQYKYRAFDKNAEGDAYPSLVHIGPSPDYFERAWDDAKYGGFAKEPFITPTVPSVLDSTLAPDGKHIVTLYGGHVAYELKDKNWDDQRDAFVKSVMDVMDSYVHDFSDRVIDMQVLLPKDIERILNIPGGHESHGEVTIDQLFHMRPVPHYADYRSPIDGVYQCGASTHPGGGVTGVPGLNAAREILKDAKKRFPTN